MFGMLVGYAVFLLFSFALVAIGGEITRTSAGYALRLGLGIFGLVAGSALVISGLGFGLGAWRRTFCARPPGQRSSLLSRCLRLGCAT